MKMSEGLSVRYLDRPGGRVSYTVQGTGPLVVTVPGMGDLRSVNRELAGPLTDAGHRVALTDLRGMGDGDVGFDEFGDEAGYVERGVVAVDCADFQKPLVLSGDVGESAE